MNVKTRTDEYSYILPNHRIALFPLAERDQSKLLVWKKGKISHKVFHELPELLPKDSTLFFNDTKVIPARILFIKPTGAVIEVFILDPVQPSSLVQLAMEAKGKATWHCTIGNLKKWNRDLILKKETGIIKLNALLIDPSKGLVEFSWTPTDLSFAEIIQLIGGMPLPPYIKRDVIPQDEVSYQTVYSKNDGAVAAPTAGLHFTQKTFDDLAAKDIELQYLTLYVSAGTFQPIKTGNFIDHKMHKEQVLVSLENVKSLIKSKNVVAVGTTSMRTLESLYWWGVKLLVDGRCDFKIHQNDHLKYGIHKFDNNLIFNTIIDFMQINNLTSITGETSIFIVPGYTFRVCNALITNYHQPKSTLILLIAAFTGENWRKVYKSALENNYRFLSYGDSSLLIP